MQNIIRFILLWAIIVLISTSRVIAQGAVAIMINPVFNGKQLELKDKQYRTDNGDMISIEVFKFYMSQLKLVNENHKFQEQNSYHLIDADDSSSLTFKIENIPVGNYSFLQFNIGVDSQASVSGALGGALDPSLGMYWAWNTGYIDAKLVGTSPSCKTVHNQFEFHIGGYKEPYITLRKVNVSLSNLDVEQGKTSYIVLVADIAKWFSGIHLTSLNNVVQPSLEALKIADNYMEMFQNSNMSENQKK